MKKRNRIRLGLLAMFAILLTGLTGYAVYAVADENVQLHSNNASVQFEADRYVDASVIIKLNGEQVGETVYFQESVLNDNSQEFTGLQIYRNSNDDKYGWVRPNENRIEEECVISFEITNTSEYNNLIVAANEITAPSNAELLITRSAEGALETGDTVIFTYTYKVTGLVSVVQIAQNFGFNLTTSEK